MEGPEYYSLYPKHKALLYFVDEEKAFDWVDWAYLYEVLNRMGFGQSFLSWISLIYTIQEADIFVVGYKSMVIQLYRGLRQGCPLSPLLFNIVILAMAVQASTFIRGVKTSLGAYKISLYADDVVFFLQDW